MNKKTENESSVADPWVTCKSKSHPGLNYYFNTVTGLKVWNITDAEIALAEKAGKNGTEPPGRPNMNKPTEANIINKQIINNQFSNQLPNMLMNTVPARAFNIWENSQNLPMQGNQLFTLVPAAIGPFYNQIDAANLQQAYQQLVAQPLPVALPLPNSIQNTNTQSYNPPQYSQNWQPHNKTSKSARYRRSQWIKKQEILNQDDTSQNRFDCNNLNNIDLRKKIVRRKSFSGACDNHNLEREFTPRTDHNSWNEETSIQMDLAPLKTLTTSGSDSNQWYIVVDADVILQNFNYLNNIAAADRDCHLYVPHHVMSELREHVSQSSNVQARRILRFLTQQIESGLAMLGEEVTCEDISHRTIVTCVQLASQNYHVVLILNNEERINYQTDMENINVFTIQEIKDILENRPIRRPRVSSPTMAVKIVVPNKDFEKIQYLEPEICETPSQRKVDPTVFANARTNSPIHTVDYSRSNQIPHAVVNRNLADSVAVTKNSVGVCSVDNSRTHYQNSPTVNYHKELTDTVGRTRKQSENAKNDYQIPRNQVENVTKELTDTNCESESRFIPRKPVLNRNRKYADTIIPKIALENSQTVCQSLQKTFVTNAKEITDPGCSNTNTEDHSSPYKPALNRSQKLTSPACTKSDSVDNLDFVTPDRSSLRSSTSNASLDTIGINKIISMNRLVSKPQTHTTNRQSSTETQQKPPSKSLSKCTSHTSSIESLVKKNESRNVTVEETSSSAISNSESSHSEKVVRPVKIVATPVKKVAVRNVVVFGVACKSMEDILKQRCDEWVFRFVQIMEEVLRVKLQEEIPFESKEPAPWNLQEAVRCIIKKFINHFYVVDAANKLSFCLSKKSDEHGKIALNIQPADYMEMYSYGLFLVETFKDMQCVSCSEKDWIKIKTNKGKDEQDSCSCYEVNAAYDSLKRLLYDIQNANMEAFVDHPRDVSIDDPIPDSDLFDSENIQVPAEMETPHYQQEESQCDDDTSKLYNLRSNINNSQNTACEELPAQEPVKGAKSLFLESLELKNTCSDNSDAHVDVQNNQDLKTTEKPNVLKNKESCTIKPFNTEEFKTPETPNDFAKPQAKIIRKFIVNEELERKVRERQNEKEYEDCAEENEDDSNLLPIAAKTHNVETIMEANQNFKHFEGRLVRKLDEIFMTTQSVCVEYFKEIRKNRESNNVRVLEHKLEIAVSFISNIRESLESIGKREKDKNNNIQMLLKLAKIDDYIPDDNVTLEYGHVIEKCWKTAGEILNIVQLILKTTQG